MDSSTKKKDGKPFEKKVVVPRTASHQQKYKLEKLLKNPTKPAFIPDRPTEKLPRVFNPPEFVRNIWGSSAGAGSGDFHVYRGVRRREYARQKFLKEKYAKDDLDEEFQKRLKEHKTAALDKTAKKRAKRLKKKGKQKNVKRSKPSASTENQDSDDEDEEDDENEGVEMSKDDVESRNEDVRSTVIAALPDACSTNDSTLAENNAKHESDCGGADSA